MSGELPEWMKAAGKQMRVRADRAFKRPKLQPPLSAKSIRAFYVKHKAKQMWKWIAARDGREDEAPPSNLDKGKLFKEMYPVLYEWMEQNGFCLKAQTITAKAKTLKALALTVQKRNNSLATGRGGKFKDWYTSYREVPGRFTLPFWGLPPTPATSFSQWRDKHEGGTTEAIDALCKQPLPLVGDTAHPNPHDSTTLRGLIDSAMEALNMKFPLSWQEIKQLIYLAGPCDGCGAGILLDGQVCQGKYDRQRLPFAPNFESKQTKKNKKNATCHFCRDPNHPIRLRRKRRRDDTRDVFDTLACQVGMKAVPTHTPVTPPATCSTSNKTPSSWEERCWSPPRGKINKILLKHFQEVYRRQPKTRTRAIKDAELRTAQESVLMYAITLGNIRIRYALFRADKVAVATALGASRIRAAASSTKPGHALLQFLEGHYTTTEPARIKIKPGGVMQYIESGRVVPACKSFFWSSKHKSLYISSIRKWRLDLALSTDNKLVWKNIDHDEEETITYTRLHPTTRRSLVL